MKIDKTYPLLLPLLIFIFGIVYQQFFEISLFWIFISLVFVGSFVAFCIFKNLHLEYARPIFYLFIFLSGIFLVGNQKQQKVNLLKTIPKSIDIMALVRNKESLEHDYNKELITLKVCKFKSSLNEKFINSSFNLIFYLKERTNLKVGNFIRVNNVRINSPLRSGAKFLIGSFASFLVKEDLLATVFSRRLSYKILSESKNFILAWLNEKRCRLYDSLKQKISGATFSFFSPIFLGYKKNCENLSNLKREFSYWGISHFLARSGLHIVLFILVWKLLLSLIPIPSGFKSVILIVLCSIYMIFSWSGISFFRAFYVFLIYEMGTLFNRSTNFVHILSIVCFIILINNPVQLFFLDFQLSFALTFALGLLTIH